MAIAYGLWGQCPKYIAGAIVNAWLVRQVYPEWEMHLWHDDTISKECLESLAMMGCKLHPKDPEIPNMYFQRMLVHDLPDVTRYIVRDCDSRLMMRERQCVDEWIKSGTLLHTIHDHPYHISGLHIMGGLFGMFREADQPGFSMKALMLQSPLAQESKWNSDQIFLDQTIWPRYSHSVTQHGKVIPIPPSTDDPDAFCGEVIDENGCPNQAHRIIRRKAK